MTNLIIALLIQNAALIHTDIYDQTYTGLRNGGRENNPIAAIYIDNGQYDLCFISAIAVNALADYIGFKFDKSGFVSQLINSGISIAELIAISNNDMAWKGHPSILPVVNVRTQIVTILF